MAYSSLFWPSLTCSATVKFGLLLGEGNARIEQHPTQLLTQGEVAWPGKATAKLAGVGHTPLSTPMPSMAFHNQTLQQEQCDVLLTMSFILSALVSAALLRKTCCASCVMYCCSCVTEKGDG